MSTVLAALAEEWHHPPPAGGASPSATTGDQLWQTQWSKSDHRVRQKEDLTGAHVLVVSLDELRKAIERRSAS